MISNHHLKIKQHIKFTGILLIINLVGHVIKPLQGFLKDCITYQYSFYLGLHYNIVVYYFYLRLRKSKSSRIINITFSMLLTSDDCVP